MEQRYRVHEQIPVRDGENALLEQLLHNRGIGSQEREAFLAPSYETHLHDPFLITDMQAAVERVLRALDTNEKVVIYSDYDCDGIPAGTLMHDLFKKIGLANFTNYIPHRHFEGFGLNMKAVEGFIAEGVQLIITLDCGTVSFDEIAHARANGIDVIVIDHHEPEPGRLPETVALLNPKRDMAYPFRELCATGVSFKFAQALLHALRTRGTDIPAGWEKWLLDVVALATISDMVPLRDENRVFVHYGLMVLRKSRRPGLQKLLRVNKLNPAMLTEDDIGFTIAPRINAASRMDTPQIGFMMLSGNETDGPAAAEKLERLNKERRGIVAAMTKEVQGRLEHMDEIPPVLVMGNPEWKPSLVGLVANSLMETYARPVFIWGRDGKGIIKGSCRSAGMSVVHLMEHAREAFLHCGGHHGAGGFEVADEAIHTLGQRLCEAYDAVTATASDEQPEELLDAQISHEAIDDVLYKTLKALAPYGMQNPKPLFRITGVIPDAVAIFGKIPEHTKITFTTGKGSLQAIAFFKKPDAFHVEPKVGTPCTLIAHAEESFFMGRRERRLRIVDVLT